MTSFVIDASVALTYLLGQAEGAEYAEAAMDALHRFGAFAPSIWPSEIANVAVVKERQGKLDADQVERLLHAAAQLPVEVDDEADVFGVVSPIARRWQRSVYDALYLEVAHRHDVPLATLDGGLRQAASGMGVSVYE